MRVRCGDFNTWWPSTSFQCAYYQNVWTVTELHWNHSVSTQAVSKKVILTNGLIRYASACSLLNSPALPLLSDERSANFPLSKRRDQVWPAYPSLSAAMFAPTPKMPHRSCCVTSLFVGRISRLGSLTSMMMHAWTLLPRKKKKDTLRQAVCLFSHHIPRSWRQNNIFAFPPPGNRQQHIYNSLPSWCACLLE